MKYVGILLTENKEFWGSWNYKVRSVSAHEWDLQYFILSPALFLTAKNILCINTKRAAKIGGFVYSRDCKTHSQSSTTSLKFW